mmetsp:Transcript_61609/g.191268  ORF Transcript_61609/g.191268 Transcript_61609/m.191268 type:complete len:223 (-) Transcript_61609:22-690(-)
MAALKQYVHPLLAREGREGVAAEAQVAAAPLSTGLLGACGSRAAPACLGPRRSPRQPHLQLHRADGLGVRRQRLVQQAFHTQSCCWAGCRLAVEPRAQPGPTLGGSQLRHGGHGQVQASRLGMQADIAAQSVDWLHGPSSDQRLQSRPCSVQAQLHFRSALETAPCDSLAHSCLCRAGGPALRSTPLTRRAAPGPHWPATRAGLPRHRKNGEHAYNAGPHQA